MPQRILPLFFALCAALAMSSCSKTDNLQIVVQQSNGEAAFGADIRIYPSEFNYLSEPTPVITGKANASTEAGQAMFEIDDLFSGDHYFDVVFHDSIGNWAINGADKRFASTSKGGEEIRVGGMQIALNHHNFLLPDNGESTWRLTDIRDTNGNSTFATALPCLTDNSLVLKKDLTLTHREGSSVCSGQAVETEYSFTHNGSSLSVTSFQGQAGTTTLSISRNTNALVAQMGTESFIYTRN